MRMTKSERRRYIRHRKKMERMALRAAEKKEKVSGQFMNRVVIAMILMPKKIAAATEIPDNKSEISTVNVYSFPNASTSSVSTILLK